MHFRVAAGLVNAVAFAHEETTTGTNGENLLMEWRPLDAPVRHRRAWAAAGQLPARNVVE